MWIYEWNPNTVSHDLDMFGDHWSSADGDKNYSFCYLVSQNHGWKVIFFYEWRLLLLCHLSANFGGQSYFGSTDRVFSFSLDLEGMQD